MYRGLIAAAGLSTRLQDFGDGRNKVLADLGGESLLTSFERCGVADPVVVTGHDAHAVRLACAGRARTPLNPFFEHYGILGSVWTARAELDGRPFVHRRIDVDFPCDLTRARHLYADHREATPRTA
jgi:choline kinase